MLGKSILAVSTIIVFFTFVSLQAVSAQTPTNPVPLQGTFPQASQNTCVPTGLGVLADTSDITRFNARYIAGRIMYYCNATNVLKEGLNVIAGVYGLIRTLNESGATTAGRNISITVRNWAMTTYNKTVNLSNGATVTIIYIGRNMTAAEINASLGGAGTSTSGGKPTTAKGSGSGGGERGAVGMTYASHAGPHFIIIVGIDMNEPENVNINGDNFVAYPIRFWDPATNSYNTGRITADGSYFDDGITWGKVGTAVTMK